MSSPSAEDPSTLVPSPLTFPVVGIGGSAGGLQALLELFQNMPEKPGMAFVVILHLARDHESNAAAILQRVTPMRVMQVTASVPIQPDHVYVIAPRANLLMNDGHLDVSESTPQAGPAVAIDVFFRTLAEVHRRRAVCVVLSGTGSDGAVGLTRVKEKGGITIAQLQGEAEHGDMPRAAAATQMVDFVLPVAKMGRKLVDLWTNARLIQLPAASAVDALSASSEPAPARAGERTLQDIMTLLRTYTRHDFRHYKPGTVMRRVERRLQVNGLPDLASYLEFLRNTPKEAVPLLQDMLISVTSFFRDRSAFEALEHEAVRPLLRARGPAEQIRVWVAGCATGEESYSLSMLLQEQVDPAPSADFQIFATDIDEQAIATARRGVYPGGVAADLSEARLHRFMLREQDRYRVTTAVRERVLFAPHNLLRDPPFSRVDLICCRNLLIYLDHEAQKSVLQMFRYALKPDGYLFLGTSESADAAGNLFSVVAKKHRIYRVNGAAVPRGHAAYLADRAVDAVPAPLWHNPELDRLPAQAAVAQQHLQALQSISASILIDDQQEVLHLSPTASRFMERSSGVVSNNLLNNVPAGMRLELRTALFEAEQTGQPVTTKIAQMHPDGGGSTLEITVHPIPPGEPRALRTLVVFDRVDGDPLAHVDLSAADPTQHVMLVRLEEENRQLKVHLQDTLERSALSTEELKASNEELQAINEELRSATEELETSKEELQSMNEELGTVNVELRIKVDEREQINDDLQNLIASSGIATVFVDSAMCIKRFTPQASKLFSLVASDIGRSLLDIKSRLDYAELAADAESVFTDLRTIERQVTATDAREYFARILPYRTVDDKIGGAVMTFVDVTDLRLAQAQALAAEERLRLAAASTSDFAIITTDETGTIETWNIGAERIFGHLAGEAVGQPIALIFTAADRAAGLPEQEMRIAAESGRAEEEGWRQRKDGTTVYCSGVMTRVQTSTGKGFAKIGRDLTGSKQQQLAQENLLLHEQQRSSDAARTIELKDRFLAVMSHELKQPLNIMQVSAELLLRLPETRSIESVIRIGQTIQRAVTSQSTIINDLLDLSRVRTGKLSLEIVPVDMSELIRSLARAAAGDFAAKDIALTVDLADGVVCQCDRVRSEQILWNLIGNAVKFTPAGGSVRIEMGVEDGVMKVSVADTGRGISADLLPSVFDMFRQADTDATPKNGGFGIGLALVMELTQLHGGRVEARSPGLGLGSVFTVWMPLNAAAGQTLAVSPAPVHQIFRGMRILTVDDDAESLAIFADLLRLEGALVESFGSGAAALAQLAAHAYDLIISDLSMPDMDGFVFVAKVRSQPARSPVIAVALSGYARPVDVQKCIAAGFDGHLAKPASLDTLRALLDGLKNRMASR